MRNLFFCLFAMLPGLVLAQNFGRDHRLFWDSLDPEEGIEVVQHPQQPETVVALRRYYGDRHDIREEYIRLDENTWLFNSYDTSGAFVRRGGSMMVDRAHFLCDTIVTFDPETYEELIRLDTIYRLMPFGKWMECDTNGFCWEGEYLNGKRQGRWSKQQWSEDDICDCREVIYQNGQILNETQFNLALTADTVLVKKAMLGSWVIYPSRRWKTALMMKWAGADFPSPSPAGNYYRSHHGIAIYYFLENNAVQGCIPNPYYTIQPTIMGTYRLSNDMQLFIDWDDDRKGWYRIRSLMGDEMIIEPID